MNKEEAIKWIVDTKAISAFTRNFVEWLYENDYVITEKPYTTEKSIREWASWTCECIRDDPSYKTEENIEDTIREVLTALGVDIVDKENGE